MNKGIEELLPIIKNEGNLKGWLRDLYNLAGGSSVNFNTWAENSLAKARPDGAQYTKVWRTKEGSFLKKNLPEDNDRYLTGLGNYIDYIVDIEVLEHIAMGMGFAPRASATMKELSYQCREYYISIRKKYEREKQFALIQQNKQLTSKNKQYKKELRYVKELWYAPTQFGNKPDVDNWLVNEMHLIEFDEANNIKWYDKSYIQSTGRHYKVSYDIMIAYKNRYKNIVQNTCF